MDPTQELGDEIIRRANVHRVLEVLEPLYGYFLFNWATSHFARCCRGLPRHG